ncbi:uncharacterized protein LOC62_03G003593 [Vanrija pseudolonga]|uniref:BTB domain-containing protein n=1 Tax=Vanrija pseudolonga TaxID=143232 RepID=A0AAF1BHD7_9TREE|nr:hypothetical protein LOC62_03G003593 [Vanrija pseudolonga]
MSSISATPDTPTIVDDDKWTTGDFALISSDNVRFRIDSYHLQAASVVFRDMITAADGPREIHFTDDAIEGRHAVSAFLHLATAGSLYEAPTPWNVSGTVKLVRFVLKFDCVTALKVLILRTKETLIDNDQTTTLHVFIIGAVLDNEDLCRASLKRNQDYYWIEGEPDTIEATSYLLHGFCFNPQTWSFSAFGLIPLPHLWALNRAWTMTKSNRAKLPDKFCELLKVAKAYKPE